MRHVRITVAAIAVAAAAAVGGIAIASAAGGSSPHPAAGSATISTATATVQGTKETILVDAHGQPLYIYQPDTATTSRVSGQLAALWPPVVSMSPTEHGATGTLASVPTSNGSQVAYNGHFLYTFVEDHGGRVTGQGVQNFFVATPSLGGGGVTGTSAPSSSAPASSTAPHTQFGY
jgi:predicted lipoprotein with Yx(FWY)xxD motif